MEPKVMCYFALLPGWTQGKDSHPIVIKGGRNEHMESSSYECFYFLMMTAVDEYLSISDP